MLSTDKKTGKHKHSVGQSIEKNVINLLIEAVKSIMTKVYFMIHNYSEDKRSFTNNIEKAENFEMIIMERGKE